MIKALLMSTVLTLAWNFEHCVEDTLEYSVDLNHTNWVQVPGPYNVVLESDGVRHGYRVPVTNANPNAFYRVSRVWGTPKVAATNLPPRTATNSFQCR